MMRNTLAAAALALTLPAHALLVVTSPTTTLDTNTGLEWLRITETTGMSFNQVVGNPAFSGWRYASEADTVSIFTQIGMPITPYVPEPAAVMGPALQKFDQFFGLNVAGVGPAFGFEALVGDEIAGFPGYRKLFYGFPTAANTAFEAGPFVDTAGGWLVNGRREVTVGYAVDYNLDRNLGSFLVRPVSAVPEPEVWALLVAGVLVLRYRAGRRSR